LPIEQRAVAAMGEKTFEPFSDFALHDIGSGLADGVLNSTSTVPALSNVSWPLSASPNLSGARRFMNITW
jgi:hypothetical protein